MSLHAHEPSDSAMPAVTFALPDLRPTRFIQLASYPRVWLKCEHENPTGSHKDRAYWGMLHAESGPFADHTFVDYTTGNGGISLAWFARQVGARAVLFMPDGMTPARSEMIRAYGAELVITDRAAFVAGARAAAEQYVAEHPAARLLGQSDNFANQRAFQHVGEEILGDCESQGVRPYAFACGIGTGGTFSGICNVLKGEINGLKGIAIEVAEAPVLWAKRMGEHINPRLPSIIGMGPGVVALNTDERLIDEVEVVGAPAVEAVLERLQRIDGLSLGPSSAANVLVASRLGEQVGRDVVTVSFDRGDRY